MRLILARRKEEKNSTPGDLFFDGAWICHTLELKYLNNVRNHSCIPTGIYQVRIRDGRKEGSRFKYPHIAFFDTDYTSWVKDRDHILIHSGNTVDDTTGCIIVGLGRSKDSVWRSRRALRKLMRICSEPLEIEVKSADGNLEAERHRSR